MRVFFLASMAALGVVSAMVGCGSDSFSITTTGAGGGGGNTTGADQGGSNANGGSNAGGSNANGGSSANGGSNANGGGKGSGGNNASGGGNASGSGGGNNGGCPDASGFYGTITHTGAGCGNLSTDGGVCVRAGIDMCDYVLTSGGAISNDSISGSIDLKPDGTFTGATIKEGGVTRTGCSGKDSGDILTVTCGDASNPNSDQYCKVTLKKTGNTCAVAP